MSRIESQGINRRIRWAGLLIASGLLIQLVTFIWTSPIAFMAFLGLGCPLVGAGILVYLHTLAVHSEQGSRSTCSDSVRTAMSLKQVQLKGGTVRESIDK